MAVLMVPRKISWACIGRTTRRKLQGLCRVYFDSSKLEVHTSAGPSTAVLAAKAVLLCQEKYRD